MGLGLKEERERVKGTVTSSFQKKKKKKVEVGEEVWSMVNEEDVFKFVMVMVESQPSKSTDQIEEENGVHVGTEKQEAFLPDCIRRGPP